jgi:penicillin-binding protein 2
MHRDMERYREFTRRAFIVGLGQTALFTVLAGQLAYLQVVEQDKFKTLSDENRISHRLVTAGRGEIMDRFGVPLAINTQNFRAFVIAEQSKNVAGTLESLSTLIPLSDVEKKGVMTDIAKQRAFTPILVKENLSWEDMAKIESNLPDLPGVSVDEGEIRSYPFGEATAHIIGYVGRISEAEIAQAEERGAKDPIMRLPGFRIGKTGVEKRYDETLRGQAGRTSAEVNVVGREIRELEKVPPKKGRRMTLTLDADLQMQCQEMLMREKSAAAVVMDAHTGEVYALCSFPGFDPNMFSRGIPTDLWEELLANETNPLTNKAVSGQYPPGSTFKMVTSLAVLEAGISPDASVYCPGHYMLGGIKFHCWKNGGHGRMGMVSALEQSCDTYFYEMGRRIGVDAIAKMGRRLGFGERLGFDIPGEGPGLMPDRAWKMKRHKEQWHQGETLNVAIGQGQVLTTPLQLATMTARLVNGGRAVKPVLVRSIEDEGNKIPKWEDMGINPAHLAVIRRGMDAVVNGGRGTAGGARIREEPYSMGGKTGTAQVQRITAAQRAAGVKNEDLPWRQRHHALFVGYGPVEDPRYVTAVIVEHGVGGSKAAAPIARDILLAAQKRDPRRIRTVDVATEAATGGAASQGVPPPGEKPVSGEKSATEKKKPGEKGPKEKAPKEKAP